MTKKSGLDEWDDVTRCWTRRGDDREWQDHEYRTEGAIVWRCYIAISSMIPFTEGAKRNECVCVHLPIITNYLSSTCWITFRMTVILDDPHSIVHTWITARLDAS